MASASLAEAIFCTFFFFVFGGTKWACLLLMIHISKCTGCPKVLLQGCSKVMRGQGGGSESPLNTCKEVVQGQGTFSQLVCDSLVLFAKVLEISWQQ